MLNPKRINSDENKVKLISNTISLYVFTYVLIYALIHVCIGVVLVYVGNVRRLRRTYVRMY